MYDTLYENISYYSIENPFYNSVIDPIWEILEYDGFALPILFGFCKMGTKKLLKSYSNSELSYVFTDDGRIKEVMQSVGGKAFSISSFSYSDETL